MDDCVLALDGFCFKIGQPPPNFTLRHSFAGSSIISFQFRLSVILSMCFYMLLVGAGMLLTMFFRTLCQDL